MDLGRVLILFRNVLLKREIEQELRTQTEFGSRQIFGGL